MAVTPKGDRPNKRRWHALKANSSSSKPICHLFVDLESHVIKEADGGERHEPWFGWCCYWRRRPEREKDTLEYRRFATVGEFWKLALSKVQSKMPLYMVSHNAGYDFENLHIFDHLGAAGFEMYSIYLGNLSVIMRFRRGKEKIILLDNCNFFTGSLASLGEAIGLHKLDVDPLDMTEAEADPYCKRDVEILVKLWQFYYEFLEVHDLGSWGSTVPSQAFRAYRHRFMPHKIVIHADLDALEIERAAYHGGRTSVFWQGASDGEMRYKLDVNSMYPYVMEREQYPAVFYGTRDGLTIEALTKKMERFAVVARVTVNTDIPVYPVKHENHLIYPVGRFDTELSTPEVKFAIEHGHIERVHTVALYEQAPLFGEYVKFFYSLKAHYHETGEGAFYLMCKLYLNALYGKFGQKSETWERFDDPPEEIKLARVYYNSRTKETWRLYPFGDQVWKARSSGEARHSAPAIAAHVTAYARLYLWELMTKAGAGNVYYCDTDSIITNDAGLAALADKMDPARLGALKIEEQSARLEILAPKHYRMGDDWKRKGIPKKAKALGNQTWEMQQWPSFKTHGRTSPDGVFRTKRVTKHLTNRIYDGTVQDDGWVTPTDAAVIVPDRALSKEQMTRIEQIDAQHAALSEALPVDRQTVFRLWDSRKGDFKRQRDKHGELVPLEYSGWDARATELGFADLRALKEAVVMYLGIRRHIRELNRERQEVLYPAPATDTQGAMVF